MTYLQHLYPNPHAVTGDLVVFDKAIKRSSRFPLSHLGQAEAYLIERGARTDVYFGWGVQAPSQTTGRGFSSTVCAFPGIMFDWDMVSDDPNVHAKCNLPERWGQLLEVVRELGLPEPTAIVHSGNGCYGQWLFDQLEEFASEEDRDRVARLSKRFQGLIIRHARERHGWELDDTSDLARITRLPGTFNHKTDPAKLVQLLQFDGSRRYRVEELEEIVSRLDPGGTVEKRQISLSDLEMPEPINDNEPPKKKPSFESVAGGCAWIQSTVERANRLPEPDWYAQASIVGRCENGVGLFHKLSKADPRYDRSEAQQKLEHALEAAGPRTCENIAKELGFEDCQRCPFRDQLTSPIELGRLHPNTVELMKNHIYDVSTNRYYNVQTLKPLDEKSFSAKFRHRTGPSTPHKLLIEHSFTRKVDVTDYLPGCDKLFLDVGEEQVLNLWRRSGITPEEGDASIISAHLSYLIPDEAERRHFLDALAHAVQEPGEKIRHCLLLMGEQGTGKSFLGALIERLFGVENVMVAESSDLTSQWTARLGNRQVLVAEELGVFERREAYENLKRWITEEFVTVNEKHVKKYDARSPRLMLAFSNHAVPIALGDGDRRFWACQSPATPKEPAYYTQLFEVGLEQAPAFLAELMRRDISNFKPSAPPPMTGAKEEILKWSRPVVQQEVEAMMEVEARPFHRDLFRVEDLRLEIAERMKNRLPSLRDVTEALKELGAVSLKPQVRRPHGEGRIRLWAWRNVERWANATTAELREGYWGTIHPLD
jgi:hypothetical protein